MENNLKNFLLKVPLIKGDFEVNPVPPFQGG